MRTSAVLWVSLSAALGPVGASQAIWQADLQVHDLTVSEAKGSLTARMRVRSELGEALAARVEVLLPVGVGLLEVSPGCSASANPSGISDLQGRVVCVLGDLPARSSREIHVVTTAPPPGVLRSFGVVALSDTPDPRPRNNFAEKAIP